MGPFDISFLIATVSLSVPILFAALGELVSERTGVINIGLEGMMIAGAFAGFYFTWLTGSVLIGVLGGMAAGMLLATVVGLVSITGSGGQVVVGIAVWIFGLGITSFFNARVFSHSEQVVVATMSSVAVPGLVDLPVIGEVFFDQPLLVYFAVLSLFAIRYVLNRTSLGLVIRAVGEAPSAVDNAGINVAAVRWLGVLTAGAFAGLGGVMLTIGASGSFTANVTAGQGFIALAAVFFGRWRPFGVLGACLVFGGANALQLRLQTFEHIPWEVWAMFSLVACAVFASRAYRRRRMPAPIEAATAVLVVGAGVALALIHPETKVPTQVWLMLPYVVTLVVLASLSGIARGPRALAVHYQRAT